MRAARHEQTIGNYRLAKVIGEGGMGTVYEAEHVLLGRRAAIKILKADLATEHSLVERFFNEARAASAIRHPGIIEIYDFGYDDGVAYIVMELLHGESLGQRLQRCRRLEPARALSIAKQVAAALAAAHAQGIVHRDLKPDNLFLVADPELDSGERVKILDFGIAKLLQQQDARVAMTSTGLLLGTPAYMSPEQCRGVGDVDGRADLYALGCILFEMLTGDWPFEAEGVGEMIAQHIYAQPRDLGELVPSIAEEVVAVVRQLLAKQPSQRFQSAGALTRVLGELCGDASGQRPITLAGPVAPAPAPAPNPSWRQRARGRVVAVIAGTCVAVAGAVLALAQTSATASASAALPSFAGPTTISTVPVGEHARVVRISRRNRRPERRRLHTLSPRVKPTGTVVSSPPKPRSEIKRLIRVTRRARVVRRKPQRRPKPAITRTKKPVVPTIATPKHVLDPFARSQ